MPSPPYLVPIRLKRAGSAEGQVYAHVYLAGSNTRAARTMFFRQKPACALKDSIAHQSGRSSLLSQSKLAPAATRTVAQGPALGRVVERHGADLPDVPTIPAHRRCHERQRRARQRQTGPHLPSRERRQASRPRCCNSYVRPRTPPLSQAPRRSCAPRPPLGRRPRDALAPRALR
jgi:hypothetical protein